MTPDQLAKSGTEHAHQTAFFAYCAVAYRHGWEIADKWAETGLLRHDNVQGLPSLPALQWIHAIPNGGARGDDARTRVIRGGQLKAEGVRQGIPDVFLPWPMQVWHGLYIEFKKPSVKAKKETSKGGLSIEQIDFKMYAQSHGYGWTVCYSWQEAVDVVKSYINWR